ncbi:MAG: hypothetical protein P8Z78_00590 [Gammaproteobacteria bacterium]|jgi:hypothetical protein
MRLEKAMLIRLADGEELPGAETIQGYRDSKEQGDGENWMRVHFNPESLKTSISTNLKSQDKGKKETKGQYIEKSDSSLSLDLVFDTSVVAPDIHQEQQNGEQVTRLIHKDVRTITRQLAEFFLKSPDFDDPQKRKKGKMAAPSRCHFRWGSFGFTGMISSINETVDYFSPEGIPLRATVSLSLKEDRYQFQTYEIAQQQNKVGSALRKVEEKKNADPNNPDTALPAQKGPTPQSVISDQNDPDYTAGSQQASPAPAVSNSDF